MEVWVGERAGSNLGRVITSALREVVCCGVGVLAMMLLECPQQSQRNDVENGVQQRGQLVILMSFPFKVVFLPERCRDLKF